MAYGAGWGCAAGHAAIALYERVGLEREGLKRNAVLIDGRYIDTIFMAKIRA